MRMRGSHLARRGEPWAEDAEQASDRAPHFEWRTPRQNVARQPCLTTFRQNCGTSTVSDDPDGGAAHKLWRRVVVQARFDHAGRVAGGDVR